MTRLPRLPTARTLGITLVIAGALACSAGRAEAACGDHVRILNGAAPAVQDPASSAPEGVPDSPRPPCHGPGCSNNSLPPSPPVAPPVPTPDSKGPALPSPANGDLAAGPRWSFPVTGDTAAVRRPSSIFHPPRSA